MGLSEYRLQGVLRTALPNPSARCASVRACVHARPCVRACMRVFWVWFMRACLCARARAGYTLAGSHIM
jgi:hypothetical protein